MRLVAPVLVLGGLAFCAGSVDAATLAPQYSFHPYGYTGGSYLNSAGVAFSTFNAYQTTTAPPRMGGYSNWYWPGMTTYSTPGRTAWVYQNNALTTVGLYTAEFIRSDSNRNSSPGTMTSTGILTGTSTTHSGSSAAGQAAWYYDGTQTIEVGLRGGSYLSDATRNVTVSAVITSPLISGTSRRTSGSTNNSKGAWVFNPATGVTSQVGFYDAVNTDGLGNYNSAVSYRMGNYAAGTSDRYNGSTALLDKTAWVYNANSNLQTRVGYTGGGYTSGVRESSRVNGLLSDGTSIGYSDNNFSTTDNSWQGRTAWRRSSAGVMTNLAPSGSKYVASSGYRYDDANQINASGQIAGYSGIWSSSLGYFQEADAWVYSNGNYQIIPAPVAPVTSGYTAFRATPYNLNDSGDVSGIIHRINNGTGYGPVSFVYVDGVSYAAGIFDADHQTPTGQMLQNPSIMSENLTVGVAYKYTPAGARGGYDAWVFDHDSHISTPLSLANFANAQGSTTPFFITPDGWVGGAFDVQVTPTTTAWHAFLWSSDTGLLDFNTLFPGGLAGQGIDYVATVTWVTPTGDIYASVKMLDGSGAAAVFVGAVPEPGLVMSAAAVSMLTLARRTRRPRSSTQEP